MGMAKIANAPVLLVGDNDRGGVFASLYGTVSLLEPEERARIKGLVINKFRGDVKILEPGLRMIEERLHIPVVGVIPMEQIDLDDEDSLSDRLVRTEVQEGLDVAVIHLPHISNFTDFNALEHYDGVSLRYVNRAAQLGRPDLILLPGTKNTMADLKWLREERTGGHDPASGGGAEDSGHRNLRRLPDVRRTPFGSGGCGRRAGKHHAGHGTSGGRDYLCGREDQNPDRRNSVGGSRILW